MRTGTYHILHSIQDNQKKYKITQKERLHTIQLTPFVSDHISEKDYKHECTDDAPAPMEYTQLKTTQFHP